MKHAATFETCCDCVVLLHCLELEICSSGCGVLHFGLPVAAKWWDLRHEMAKNDTWLMHGERGQREGGSLIIYNVSAHCMREGYID